MPDATQTRKSPPTSSWPPRRARRPASSSRSRSARWCWRSSRWWRSPTASSAGSAGWFGYPAAQLPGDPRLRLRADHVPAQRAVGRGADRRAACSARRSCSTNSSPIIDLGKAAAALSARAPSRSSPSRCAASPISRSIAIQMAVTGGLAPNQRPMIAKLGLRALAAGSLANLMSAGARGVADRLAISSVVSLTLLGRSLPLVRREGSWTGSSSSTPCRSSARRGSARSCRRGSSELVTASAPARRPNNRRSRARSCGRTSPPRHI